ncbi:MAG: DNA primase small subunit domain-containing protein [Nitrososphaeria archaeon]
MKKVLIEKDTFLKKTFKKYYYGFITKLRVPSRLPEREIGYLTFSPERMVRHLALKSEGELRALILHEVPKALYYSSAYYDDPSAPINERIWKGADLIFDIDLDHLPYEENLMTSFYICPICKNMFDNLINKNCPNCNSQTIEEVKIATKKGLESCKKEIIKLTEILEKDFGLLKDNFCIYFSGKRGYHLTVEGSKYEIADQPFRIELSDYLTLNGFKINRILNENISIEQQIHQFPSPWERGWLGRFSREYIKSTFSDFINHDEDSFRKILLSILSSSKHENLLSSLESIKKRLSVKIDVAVTTDVHRIFRMPDTLHGGTGLVKKKVDEIDKFSPLTDAVVLSDEPTKIHVLYSPKLELKDTFYGPYKNEDITLPEYVATFLVAMGLAQTIENS